MPHLQRIVEDAVPILTMDSVPLLVDLSTHLPLGLSPLSKVTSTHDGCPEGDHCLLCGIMTSKVRGQTLQGHNPDTKRVHAFQYSSEEVRSE